jgi:hypothetical protein
MADDPPSTLTAEGARYWLRAAEWHSTNAAFLLSGINPNGFDASEALTDEEESLIESVLGEITHVEGSLALLGWDSWTPMQWIEAARKACLPIPDELAGALPAVKPMDKPMRDVERRTLLTIIAAMARAAKIDTTRHEAAGVTIAKMTDEIGAPVDSGTIARHLKKIPDALETRTK